MKRIRIFVTTFFLLIIFFTSENSLAQGKGQKKVKNNYKKETGPPPWAPAHGYRAKTRYVYFSEHNFYYDNSRGVYIYLSGKNWEISANIPSLFKNFDLSAAVKIDLDFDADDPQKYNTAHLSKYNKR